MTKEELEKEATEYAQKLGVKDFIAKPKEIVAYFGYLAGAEPREKQIAELEAQIEKMKEMPYSVVKECANEILRNENERLKAQIEKMKWHKVSDGDLPKDRHNVYVVYMNGYCQLEKTIASFRHKYWVFNGLKTECEIIAWCELPEWR